jgi:hypothetical protein
MSPLESNESNPKRKRGVTDNNTSNPRSTINTSAVDNGSGKKNKKIADIVKEYCANPKPKGTTDAATRELSESIERATSEAKQCVSNQIIRSKGVLNNDVF